MANNQYFGYYRRQRLSELVETLADAALGEEIRCLLQASSFSYYRERKLRAKIRDLEIRLKDLETI